MIIKKLINRWRDRRAGVPPEFQGMSLDGIPAHQWGGWNHTIIHCDEED